MEGLSAVLESLPYILSGIPVTLGLVALSLALGFTLGVPMAVATVYGNRVMAKIIQVFVFVMRGLPNLVLLFLFYFGIFPLLGWNLSPFVIGVITLGLRSAAYQTEIFRGAILSLEEGQMLAALSVGMTKNQAIWNIILPQALRLALPGWSNEYPILLTDSSVTYAIGVAEILTRGSQMVTRTYQPMPIYLTCALIFILLNWGGMQIIQWGEKKAYIPGLGRKIETR
ncbi:MAG TPA: amino acid ABC transporter permease [Candidatus Atribacteria bacterium]|uniref:amino acid ABC transporter permease n=1 Tax=Candidatus Sordicultor fermentans TaxID=1953203 RepID=UPI00169D39EB|nr:amino acid ABC transporter permease [Candidatus Atribacteria bacterium]HPT63936.1 amino acid ABC transporter permease [Candidatus Atribacteria bacterium]